MKKVKMIFSALVLNLFVLSIAAAQNWVVVYETDFSSNPFLNGWTTNNSERYFWDSGSQSLFTNNYTNSGDWATTDIAYNGESFFLSFDILPIRDFGETGDIDIGLFGPTRYSNGPGIEERVFVMFGGYDQPGVGAIYTYGFNSGGEVFWSGPGAGLMLNGAWHHVELTYDSEAVALSLEVTRDGSPVLSCQTAMNYGFSSDLLYLGASMAGEWITSNRHETAYIDNIIFALDVMEAIVDIKPGSCPNPLNVGKKGVIPLAILGTEDFDVFDIDPTTVLLQGVPPIPRFHMPEDVAAPVPDTQDECDCDTLGPDGFADRVFHFDAQQIVEALGEINDGDEISLTLTGQLMDGTEFTGSDCIIVLKPRPWIPPKPDKPMPQLFQLTQNYPNPFNAQTTIQYSLTEQSAVSIDIFDILGRRIETLSEGIRPAGAHHATWDATNQPSGTYFYKINTAGVTEIKKMTLLK